MKVPILKQGKDLSCGAAALRMVFAYYEFNISEKEIIRQVGGLKSYGLRLISLAKFAEQQGFQVECLSYNPRLAKNTAKIKKPLIVDIDRFLQKDIPVVLPVRAALLLYNKPPKSGKFSDAGHIIVVTDYKDDKFRYNDPLDAKQHRIKSEHLFFAWHNKILDSSAYLLAVWR